MHCDDCRWVKVNNCVVCHALIPQSDNVLLATIDGTIITFDQVRDPSQTGVVL